MRPPLAAFAIAIAAITGCACSPIAAPPTTTAKPPPPRLVIWADSHGDEPTDWPAKLGCADQVIAHIGWAIADQGPGAPAPLTDQIASLSKSLRRGDRVVVALGANDAIDTSPPFAADLRGAIDQTIKARSAVPIWATVLPNAKSYGYLEPLDAGRRNEHNKWVRSLPPANRVDPSAVTGDTLDPGEQVGDSVHLTGATQAKIADRLRPALC